MDACTVVCVDVTTEIVEWIGRFMTVRLIVDKHAVHARLPGKICCIFVVTFFFKCDFKTWKTRCVDPCHDSACTC